MGMGMGLGGEVFSFFSFLFCVGVYLSSQLRQ
jgi:hypothetical protein